MRADELMTPFVEKVTGDADLASAGRRFVALGIHHLPVVDDEGRLSGVVFDHDVFAKGAFIGEMWVVFDEADNATTVGSLVHPVEVTARAADELTVLLRRMATQAQDCAIVVDEDQRPVGIITEHDVLRVAVEFVGADIPAEVEASQPVLAIADQARGPEAHQKMTAARIRHLPVVDDDGRVTGVISMRDLLADDAAHRPELHVYDIVRRDEVRTALVGTSLRGVAASMIEGHVGCVPLVDVQGHPKAIVTRRDVLGAAVAALEGQDLFPG